MLEMGLMLLSVRKQLLMLNWQRKSTPQLKEDLRKEASVFWFQLQPLDYLSHIYEIYTTKCFWHQKNTLSDKPRIDVQSWHRIDIGWYQMSVQCLFSDIGLMISITPDLRTRFPREGVGFMSGLVIVFVSETFCSVLFSWMTSLVVFSSLLPLLHLSFCSKKKKKKKKKKKNG